MSDQWSMPANNIAGAVWSTPVSDGSTDRIAGLQSAPIADSATDRISGLQDEVAAIRIRGGNTKVERQVRVGGTALMAVGVVLIIIGWFKASAANTSVNNQIAYLISGGLLGLAFIGIGAAVYLRSWLARQRYWLARQVVETREYTTQVLLLLARIEKVLGGTGELPGDQIKSIGSHWEKLATPPMEDFKSKKLLGNPDSTIENISLTRHIAEVDSDDPLLTLMSTERSLTEELMETAFSGTSQELELEDASQLFTNEHGHVWDDKAQQWYDPISHQWYDGIRGSWYRRDSAPPTQR